jgi:hypothetical protein
MFESSDRYYRAPVGFGPAASPRQTPQGDRFDWSKARTTTVGITHNVSVESVQKLLPQGYKVDVGDSNVTQVLFEVMELRNLPWLAGRGYNTWGIYFANIRCDTIKEPRKGSYMAVLFESFTDPITTGREELGFPKIWAELPDGKISGDKRTHTASWFGYEFMKLEISGLKQHDPQTAPALNKRAFTHPTQNGILHHRYVPTVGYPGQHDASYTTWCPPPPGKAPVTSYYAPFPSPQPSNPKESAQVEAKVKFSIMPGSFEQLPTLYNIVDGLGTLELKDVVEVAVQEFAGASDLSESESIFEERKRSSYIPHYFQRPTNVSSRCISIFDHNHIHFHIRDYHLRKRSTDADLVALWYLSNSRLFWPESKLILCVSHVKKSKKKMFSPSTKGVSTRLRLTPSILLHQNLAFLDLRLYLLHLL